MSCAADSSEARFEVARIVAFEDCMRRAFPFEPKDLRAQRHPFSTTLFFQHNAGLIRDADLLTLEVFAEDPTAQPIPMRIQYHPAPRPGEPLAQSDLTGDQPRGRGDLQFLHSCPLVNESFLLDGVIEFSEFGNRAGDTITGSISARIINARSGQQVAERLSGSFTFTVRSGRPGEDLYDARQR